MLEDEVEREAQVLLRRLAAGADDTVEQRLRRLLVVALPGLHRLVVRRRPIPALRVRVGPAREDLRETLDDRLVVGRDRLQEGVEQHAAVGIELQESDREQLLDLARVVLVGADVVRRVRLAVPEHAQVAPHDRALRDVLEQRAVVAQAVLHEHVVVPGHAQRVGAERRGDVRDDEDLAQREGHALAQLVGFRQHVLPPLLQARFLAEAHAVRRERCERRTLERGRAQALFLEPGRVADHREALDLAGGRAKGRAREEARRLHLTGRRIRPRHQGLGRTAGTALNEQDQGCARARARDPGRRAELATHSAPLLETRRCRRLPVKWIGPRRPDS